MKRGRSRSARMARLASSAEDHLVKLWDVAKGTEMQSLADTPAQSLAWPLTPVAGGLPQVTPPDWSRSGMSSGQSVTSLGISAGIPRPAAFHPDGKRLLIAGVGGSGDPELQLWGLDAGRLLRTFR